MCFNYLADATLLCVVSDTKSADVFYVCVGTDVSPTVTQIGRQCFSPFGGDIFRGF